MDTDYIRPTFKTTLPNGIELYGLNAHEIDFMYREIFVEEVYFKHGITISDGAIVFDIGANIGMFSLFVKSVAPEARILAFEPAPYIFQILSENLSGFRDSISLFQVGVSDYEGTADFVFYPGYSIMSGFHTQIERDREILKVGILDQLREKNPALLGTVSRRIETMVDQKLAAPVTAEVKIIPLSKAFGELAEGERVRLLKIDAEGAEVNILEGLLPSEWDRIDQIVMEIHGQRESLAVRALFEANGFSVIVDPPEVGSEILTENIYALRNPRWHRS